MINLSGITDLFKLTTGSAGAIDVTVSYVDGDYTTPASPTFNPDKNVLVQVTTAATTTILGSPAANHRRNVKNATARNASTTSANTVTPILFDGTTNATLYSYTLQPGDAIHYDDLNGWKYAPSTNSIQVPGRLLSTTVHTTGTTHTVGHFTNTMKIRGQGGGGGGAGCTSVAASASAGGGGGCGGYGEKLFTVNPDTAYTYAIGTAGGGNSGAGGGNGGDSTFTVGATTVTAKGATGAVVATAVNTLSAYPGGAGGVVGTNGDVNAGGSGGEPGVTLLVATPIISSGSGASGPFGGGGIGLTAVGNGNAGTGNGSGGGGAATGASAVRTGGTGTVGIWVVDEFA